MKDTNNQGQSLQERLSEAEERWKTATISDIIAAKRREADSIEQSARGSFKAGESWDDMPFTESDLESALDLAETKRKEANRLEAALKRECGDAAKLREALVRCREIALQWQADEAAGVAGTTDKPHARSTAEAVIDMEFEINAALAATEKEGDTE